MEIKINGQNVEFVSDSKPAITRKSIDINNPSARYIDYTNKFRLSNSHTNRQIFDNPENIESDGQHKYYNVSISDIYQIFRGKGILINVNDEYYDLQVVDQSTDLFKKLKAKINTIDIDSQDTELSTSEIDLLDTNSLDNIWIWNKLCLHENAIRDNTDQISGGGNDRTKYSRPCFNLQSFLKAAIEAEGYTYSSSNTLLAFAGWHKEFFFTSYQKTLDTTYAATGTYNVPNLDTNDFEHPDISTTSTVIDIDTKKLKFRLRGSITSDASVDVIVRGTDQVDPTKVTDSVLKIAEGSQDVDFSTSDFQSDNGIDIELLIVGTGSVTFDEVFFYSLHSDKDEDLSTNPFLAYKIKAFDNLPDLSFIDLYRTICIIGNEYHKIDNLANTFEWLEMSEMSKLNSVDWSDKFIIESFEKTKDYKGLAQQNNLSYTNDITLNQEFGKSNFVTSDETIKKESDYFKLVFGASKDVVINSNRISQADVYNDTTRIVDQELSMRVFNIDDDKLNFESLKWENLKAANYQALFNALAKPIIINAQFNLESMDVLKWEETQLAYIDYFSSTFIVLEISNFIPGKQTKVKLLHYGR